MTACVFRLCSSPVTMVAELARPGSDEALRRVPQHPLGGREEFGLCPGSLLLVPLSAYDAEQLEQQAVAIERLIEQREARPDRPAQPSGEPGRLPGRLAMPDPNPRWFRPGPGGGSRHNPPTVVSDERIEQVLVPHPGRDPEKIDRPPLGVIGPVSTGKGSMSTVAEVRATVGAAVELEAQAVDALFAVQGDLGAALQLLNVVRESSVSDMGAPLVAQAIEKLDEARVLLGAATEDARNYVATL